MSRFGLFTERPSKIQQSSRVDFVRLFDLSYEPLDICGRVRAAVAAARRKQRRSWPTTSRKKLASRRNCHGTISNCSGADAQRQTISTNGKRPMPTNLPLILNRFKGGVAPKRRSGKRKLSYTTRVPHGRHTRRMTRDCSFIRTCLIKKRNRPTPCQLLLLVSSLLRSMFRERYRPPSNLNPRTPTGNEGEIQNPRKRSGGARSGAAHYHLPALHASLLSYCKATPRT